MCGTGLTETDSQPAGAHAQGTEDPRPVTLPYLERDEAGAGVEYTEEEDATNSNSGSDTEVPKRARDDESSEGSRSKSSQAHRLLQTSY
ncbi:Hypothetical protein FKW44_010160 [Caligus rogercresseyi]|uniref:Uncharacterized protein n=1 Tax=Caligus rogercresseyi TaxID=217165 RepID=A0A7T8HGL0_CALRO|nr:Hypothetical protein FKW44_010160 [Caligus rogercresseyi]